MEQLLAVYLKDNPARGTVKQKPKSLSIDGFGFFLFYMTDRFIKLNILMRLKRAALETKRVQRIKVDLDSGRDRILPLSKKKLIEKYRQLVWCIHVKNSLRTEKPVPEILFVNNGNIVCKNCRDKIVSGDSKKNEMVLVPASVIEKLANKYEKQMMENQT